MQAPSVTWQPPTPQPQRPKRLIASSFYDCPPLDKRLHNPVTGKSINLGNSDEARFRLALHEELKRMRKVALRLGRITDYGHWTLRPTKTKALLNGKLAVADLQADDVTYEVRQKGVDMRIGLDIASLAYQKDVDQIILIAGDSDFVPAAKLARRQGIDFVLDPMWNHINPDLHEHIDGRICCWPEPSHRNDMRDGSVGGRGLQPGIDLRDRQQTDALLHSNHPGHHLKPE